MKLSKLAVVLLGVPAVLGTSDMRRVYRRQGTGILPVPDPQTSTTPKSTSTTPTSTSTTPTSTSTTPTSTSTTSTPTSNTSTSSPTSNTSKTSQTSKTTTLTTTGDDGQPITLTVTTKADITPTPTPTETPPPAAPSNSKATIIGLSVAGGVALLGVVAFIVWKMKQKRFSQFDDEDPGAIKWPEATPDVNRNAAAAEAGVAARPTADPYGTHATNSTVELDPYQVPPLPHGGYRDDPNIQAGGYYDPYRGPVPNTFASPPQSHDGHGAAPWGAPGEAIPMSVRRGTPGPPGPGGYDDYRRGSPAPYSGGAPSIRRGPSPGPNFAGGPPDYGRGSPAPPPPNFNRQPANLPYDDPYGGTA